jgi:hypothetical protein
MMAGAMLRGRTAQRCCWIDGFITSVLLVAARLQPILDHCVFACLTVWRAGH